MTTEPTDSMVSTAGADKAADFAMKVRIGHHQLKVERLCAELEDVKRHAAAIVAEADRIKAELAAELETMKGRG